MKRDLDSIKAGIIAALSHPEADEGLYFRNFVLLDAEDERPAVEGEQVDILDALRELLAEGRVLMNDGPGEAIFYLAQR